MAERTIGECSIVPCCVGTMDMSVAAAAQELAANNAKQLIILENEKPIGLVTLSDLVYKVVAESKKADRTKVSSICTKEIFFLDKNEPLQKAYMYMLSANHFFCPIVSNRKFIGLLTLSEVMKQIRRT